MHKSSVIFAVLHVIFDVVHCQSLERKKRTLLSQKMPFAKGRGRGWSEDAFSSEDGPYVYYELVNSNYKSDSSHNIAQNSLRTDHVITPDGRPTLSFRDICEVASVCTPIKYTISVTISNGIMISLIFSHGQWYVLSVFYIVPPNFPQKFVPCDGGAKMTVYYVAVICLWVAH